MAKKKSDAVILAELEARQENIKLAVNTATKLLTENKLAAGLVSYAALTAASRVKDARGVPYLAPVNAALLKGLSVGYMVGGGWPGVAVGTAYAAGENIANLDLGGVVGVVSQVGETIVQSNPVSRFVTSVWNAVGGYLNR